jgi:hypothetical protein
MDGQFHADLQRELLLRVGAPRSLEFLEQLLELAMVRFQKCNSAGLRFGHEFSP